MKTICLVSHTHWDREWYLSHAKHNYRLIRFLDRLIDVLEQKEAPASFHLDGQVILLDDYLEVRPDRRERLCRLVREGRLKIGPFYILQDEYLISGEANVRNLLYGFKECEKYGPACRTGYFPDAFGNVSQIPQLLRGFGMDAVAFGRGIIPTGYANEVLGKSEEGFSEIVWEGADGSEVLAVQFVNWYNNANELPREKKALAARLQKLEKDSALAARTPFLLGMNGCDHQPVQADLDEVLQTAAEVFQTPVRSVSLDEYVELIRPWRAHFYRYRGEICGQNGDGFGTLIDTASSRIEQKQKNARAQYLLETLAEPLSVLAESRGIPGDWQLLYWCWKKLLQNHTHDGICGCSVDPVHRGMDVRFGEVLDTAECYLADLTRAMADQLETSGKTAVVFNPGLTEATDSVEFTADYLEGETPPEHFCVRDEEGNVLPCTVLERRREPIFLLPDDGFRQVHEAERIRAAVRVSMPPFATRRLTLCEGAEPTSPLRAGPDFLENEFVRLQFHANGSFDLLAEGAPVLRNQNTFEEVGDGGNEYEFKGEGKTFDTLSDRAKLKVSRLTSERAVMEVENHLRTQDGGEMCIRSEITLKRGSRLAEISVSFRNTCKNHRVCACFGGAVGEVLAESPFDLIRRPFPGARWKRPENPQRTGGAVMLLSGEGGGVWAGRGLNAYEALPEGKLRLVLLRGVGEMGDWFTFPTEDSQGLGERHAEYAVTAFGPSERDEAVRRARNFCRPPLFAAVTGPHAGQNFAPGLSLQADGLVLTSCLKRAEDQKGWILRLFNPGEGETSLTFSLPVRETDLKEEACKEPSCRFTLGPKKIMTFRLDRLGR